MGIPTPSFEFFKPPWSSLPPPPARKSLRGWKSQFGGNKWRRRERGQLFHSGYMRRLRYLEKVYVGPLEYDLLKSIYSHFSIANIELLDVGGKYVYIT